ncbi:sporulation histidine kinase inhibitor Sda [Oceanobacillus halotolerans]|uniref:sporulation histidine kinase inhibitor Sda n=1 Tax=Oceanobacillus halotolerans TaxID=2663380 RepID=UPI0013DB3E27|nr:sporulation histidine kinase inhibitor Sda [Oceanobacillus halotolerans]
MDKCSNALLIDTYKKAIEVGLGKVFVQLIVEEMNKRSFKDEELSWIDEINKKVV